MAGKISIRRFVDSHLDAHPLQTELQWIRQFLGCRWMDVPVI